ASVAAFLCLMLDHFECPDTTLDPSRQRKESSFHEAPFTRRRMKSSYHPVPEKSRMRAGDECVLIIQQVGFPHCHRPSITGPAVSEGTDTGFFT
ncbi:MAG: hypothetical protein QGG90_07560, partial [Nitrospinota bacterium]|nr:hypothetical protein [Nitrospinota bacterium]